MGELFRSYAQLLSGILLGFIMGPLFACTMLAIMPAFIWVVLKSVSFMAMAGKIADEAYGSSAGYAEQCLGAIKVVVAFGMEKIEAKNYEQNLEIGRQGGSKAKSYAALGLGMMLSMVYICYAYAFYVGSWFVQGEVINRISGNPYTFSDVLGVFYGSISGLFGVAMSGNHLRGVVDARTAGK